MFGMGKDAGNAVQTVTETAGKVGGAFSSIKGAMKPLFKLAKTALTAVGAVTVYNKFIKNKVADYTDKNVVFNNEHNKEHNKAQTAKNPFPVTKRGYEADLPQETAPTANADKGYDAGE